MGLRSVAAAVLTAMALAVPSLQAAGVGTTGASFLKVGVGARALGMAGATAAISDDANSIYWNPAGLGQLEKRSVSVSYNQLFQDESQGFIGFAGPVRGESKDVFGLGVNYLQVSDIEKRAGDTETPDSTFSNRNFAVALSYARKDAFIDKLSLGGSVKLVHVKLDSFSEEAFAVDLGAVHKINDELSAGLSVQNLGNKLGPDPLPLLMKYGVAYRLWDKLIVAADGDHWVRDKRNYGSLGTEYWIVPQFAIRAGYQLGRAQDQLGGASGLGTGIGVRIERLAVDYAYVPFGDLGHTHRVTLGARF
ncbi:MAG: PorV/PorQ family protein [Elusimicrobia bacterium]|nr:PorV/PorQ family protein [Elusimicrobiota bacterium]